MRQVGLKGDAVPSASDPQFRSATGWHLSAQCGQRAIDPQGIAPAIRSLMGPPRNDPWVQFVG